MQKELNNFLFGNFFTINNLTRYSGMCVNSPQSVTEHSHNATCIAMVLTFYENEQRRMNGKTLAKIDVGEVVKATLLHDLDESMLRADIPYNVKYYPNGGDKLRDSMEKLVLELSKNFFVGLPFPNELKDCWLAKEKSKEIYNIIKYADWLDVIRFARQEIILGNKNFCEVFERGLELIKIKANYDITEIESSTPYLSKMILEFVKSLGDKQINEK